MSGEAAGFTAEADPRLRGFQLGDAALRRAALVSLAALGAVLLALAIPVAAPGSTVVLAAADRSPDWLLGPWHVLGAEGADGALTGPLYYAGLWLAILLYVAVLASSRAIGLRLAAGAILAAHLVFLLAPPLLSQDVFSYISYARLDAVHGLNPYTHRPADVPSDAAYVFAGSKDATSVYGPLFTLATLPLAKTSVATAFWTLKVMAALASLGVVALCWGCARRLGRDPIRAALVVGLNPLVLVHVVGGAHNDGLLMLGVLGAVLAVLIERERLAGALSILATAVKASSGLALPFLIAGSRRRIAVVAGAMVAAIAIGAAALAGFGLEAFDAFGLISENQARTSRWSVPQRTADGLGALTGAPAGTLVNYTRGAFALALVAVVLVLLRRSARAEPGSAWWLDGIGWATLALLVASAWLVPWYAIWVLPFAALSRDRRLLIASIAFCAYMMVIAVPL